MMKKLTMIALLTLFASASSAVEIRIATWNMELGLDAPGTPEFNAATSILARVNADIVGMNELSSSTYENMIALAAAMNYPYTAFSWEYNALTGPSRLGFISRFPILSATPIPQFPNALEVARPPLRCVFEVPGALNDFVVYEVHYKASQTDPDEFQRAIEVRRTRSNIVEYITSNPLNTEFVVMGDMNDDIDTYPGQAVSYSNVPSGISSSFDLGDDVTFPVYYRVFPNDRFSEDIDFLTIHPYREDSTEDGTSWQTNIRWDYMIFSRDIMESPYGAPAGEVYHSAYDDGVGGLPKYGTALNNWIITNGPNHCLLFADMNLMDLLPCLNPVLMISEVVNHSSTNANFVELYNSGTTALVISNYQLVVYVDGTTPYSVSLKGSISAGGKYLVAAHSNTFVSTYGMAPTLASAYVGKLSGNDVVAIKNPNNALSDIYGVPSEPSSGSDYSMVWAYRSNRAERVLGYSDPSSEYITNEWTLSNYSTATPGVHSACDEASVYYAGIDIYPSAPKTGQTFAVTADIKPNLPASNLSATLYYRLNSGSWSNAGMSSSSGTIWTATNINPGALGNDQLHYYVLTTFSGPSAVPMPSATNLYQYPPAPGSAGESAPRFNEVECSPVGVDTYATNAFEFFEIIAPAGMDLAGYFVIHHNGADAFDGGEWKFTFPSFVVPDDGVTDIFNTALGFVVIAQTNSIVANTDFSVLTAGSIMNDADGLVLYDAWTNPVDAIVWGAGTGDMTVDDPGTVSTSVVSSLNNYLHDLPADAGDNRSLQAPCDVLNDTGSGWVNLTTTPGAMNGRQTNEMITISTDLGDDGDGDGFLDYYDNCDNTWNPTQADLDGDGIGNACDDDIDGDGVANTSDNCPNTPNTDQADMDSDGTGDVCDYDNDNDGVEDETDNCPYTYNPGQEDLDGDGWGDSCDNDLDNDGVTNGVDNCPTTSNASQSDIDTDGMGDACDTDIDGDGVANASDNCPLTYNPSQVDSNTNGIGDACESDTDLDGISDLLDNCPDTYNPDQVDADHDGAGDACDSCTGVLTTNLLANAEFESGQPSGWTVRTNANSAGYWRFDNPGFKSNYTGATGLFAVCQSDLLKKLMDTELLTPAMDMANAMTADLQFKTDFDYDTRGNSETCDVDVSVSGLNGPWTNVWRKKGADYRGPATETVNISFASGYTNVIVRFRYSNAYQEYWWQVDDVKVLCEICDASYDGDGDGVADISDNCPNVWNPTQVDLDSDDLGDECDDDIDGDGIVNTWETLYGLSPTNASDALIDSDGDTAINLSEYRADTNPTNINSALRISQSAYASALQKFSFTFPTTTNRQYRVDFNDGLVGNTSAWYVGIATFTGKDGSSTITDSTVNALSPSTTRYYRVRAQVP